MNTHTHKYVYIFTHIAYNVVTWHFHQSLQKRKARNKGKNISIVSRCLSCSSTSCHYVYWNRENREEVVNVCVEEERWRGVWGLLLDLALLTLGFTLITQTWVSCFQHRVLHANISFLLGLIHLFMCVSVWVWVWAYFGMWVLIHSLMHSFIFIISMLLSQQNLTYFTSLICTYSCPHSTLSLTPSLSSYLLTFHLTLSFLFFLIFTKLCCDFVHLISVCLCGFSFSTSCLKQFFFYVFIWKDSKKKYT